MFTVYQITWLNHTLHVTHTMQSSTVCPEKQKTWIVQSTLYPVSKENKFWFIISTITQCYLQKSTKVYIGECCDFTLILCESISFSNPYHSIVNFTSVFDIRIILKIYVHAKNSSWKVQMNSKENDKTIYFGFYDFFHK